MRFLPNRHHDVDEATINGSTAHNSFEAPNNGNATFAEKLPGTVGTVDNYPILTFRTFFMAMLVAMGGFIFGYDTGQISGFLEMKVFLEYFGEPTTNLEEHPTGFYFTNVRAGLIVGLVCFSPFGIPKAIPMNKTSIIVPERANHISYSFPSEHSLAA